MRKYLKEINELSRERDTIKEKMNRLENELKMLRSTYGREVYRPTGAVLPRKIQGSVDDMLWNAHLLYWSTNDEYKDLLWTYVDLRDRVDKLRDEYRSANRRSFYRPMEEIDIRNLIDRDGYIIGIKF